MVSMVLPAKLGKGGEMPVFCLETRETECNKMNWMFSEDIFQAV